MARRRLVVGEKIRGLTIVAVLPTRRGAKRKFVVECERGHRAEKWASHLYRGSCAACHRLAVEAASAARREQEEYRRATTPRRGRWRQATGRSLAEWAAIYGVSRQAIHERIRRHGSPHRRTPVSKGGG